MPTPRQLYTFGQGLIVVSFVSFLGAVIWWHRFYSRLLQDDVKMASECFYQTTPDCAAGNYVVSMISEVPVYRPELLWAACIVMVAGVLLFISNHQEAREESKEQ